MTPEEQIVEAAAREMCLAEHIDPNSAALVGMKTMRCWEARIPSAKAALIAGLRKAAELTPGIAREHSAFHMLADRLEAKP